MKGQILKESTVADSECEAEDDLFLTPGPSAVAQRLKRLKSAVFSVAEARERLPHPLFWSLFHGEVAELKKRKDRERILKALTLDIEVL